MGSKGEPGGLYVLLGEPDKRSDLVGEPLARDAHGLKAMIDATWEGPVTYDYAVRCHGANDKHRVDNCRRLLRAAVERARPQRILAVGESASFALVGRVVEARRLDGAHAFLSTGAPIFFLPEPQAEFNNRFVKQRFQKALSFALNAVLAPPAFGGEANEVETEEDAQVARALMEASRWVAFDCETMGAMFDDDFALLSVALCPEKQDRVWVWGSKALDDPGARAHLAALFGNPKIRWLGHNVKFDCLAIRCGLGVEVAGERNDTRLWRKLLETESDGDLETLSEMVGWGGHKEEAQVEVAAAVKRIRKGDLGAALDRMRPEVAALHQLGGKKIENPHAYAYACVSPDVLYRYNARDAMATAALAELLGKQLAGEPHVNRTWKMLVRPALSAIEQMEAWGIAIDERLIGLFQAHLDAELKKGEQAFAAYQGFNPDSTKQVVELLFGKIGLPSHKVTDKGAPSTDRESLEALRGAHPIVDALLARRKLTKLKGTYADGLFVRIRKDGRIHPTFLLDGARSGRLSCSDPNMQNVPRAKDSAEGKMLRDCFVAPPGRVLVEADFSQLELRIAAMLSGDALMASIFERGEDFHLSTAQMIARQAWGIAPEQIEATHRTFAKAVNFGTLYGQSPGQLAKSIGVSYEDAERLQNAILGRFHVLGAWIKERLREARHSGYSWTWWDGAPARRRNLYRIADQGDSPFRSVAEHASWNTPIQGTAHDYCLASLAGIVRVLRDPMNGYDDPKLVLAVHDSLMVECREEEAFDIAGQMLRVMRSWPTANGVRLDADVKIGRAWGSMNEFSKKPSGLSNLLRRGG